MLNKFTKMLLVATSLAPTLLIMSIDRFFHEGSLRWDAFGVRLVIVAVSLVVAAYGVMTFVRRNGGKQSLRVCKAKNSDKQVLTFLLAYLLPILNEHKYLFKDFDIPTLAILLLVSLAIYHSNAFDFNPLLGMLGYHFYEVESDDGFPYILISPKTLVKPCATFTVVKLCDYTFLQIED
ncbi:hypothetical protein [Planctellipticum variicoloris]|uniref:hypothetical protein n=1 Tax=Planctellipticum variicoloris TaxID=3064265 RepID=UPI003013BBFC|nr:hypothetical protein SH412_002973 [Planctomycetaceae bacterium SH412]